MKDITVRHSYDTEDGTTYIYGTITGADRKIVHDILLVKLDKNYRWTAEGICSRLELALISGDAITVRCVGNKVHLAVEDRSERTNIIILSLQFDIRSIESMQDAINRMSLLRQQLEFLQMEYDYKKEPKDLDKWMRTIEMTLDEYAELNDDGSHTCETCLREPECYHYMEMVHVSSEVTSCSLGEWK